MDRVWLNFRIVFTILLGLWGMARLEGVENGVELADAVLHIIAAGLLFTFGFTKEELD